MEGAGVATASRDELLRLLGEAAELEHSLTCQYLFAALSIKREEDGIAHADATRWGNWARLILMVARQEMEHLGLVCNLLTAVGGAPTFGHRRFPYSTDLFGGHMTLAPLSVERLRTFVCFERPEHIAPADAFCADPAPTRTVGELYERIRTLLIELDGPDLYLGPVAAEVTGVQIGTDFPRVGGLGGGYDVFLSAIGDQESALRAIDLIIEQGEGTPVGGDDSHYRNFLAILEELERTPGAAPARPVVANPSLVERDGATLVTDPAARAVMELFDHAYRTMLLVLMRLWTATDESPEQIAGLRSVAFMPLMTMAIRPLAEVLTTMPAHESGGPERAGPSFDAGGPVAFLPHREAAWRVLAEQFSELAARADAIAGMDGVPERLGYIATTLELLARKFDAALGAG